MKVLIDHALPFFLAHGGYQTQIEATRRAVERAGVETDWVRWWDSRLEVDLIHYFSPVDLAYLAQAKQKHLPVVLTSLLGGDIQLSEHQLRRRRAKLKIFSKLPGLGGIDSLLPWQSFHLCAMNHVSLEAEKRILCEVYGVPAEKVAVVPYGMSDAYLNAEPSPRTGDFLICTGTICQRKRSVETARLALAAQVPIYFVGKPYYYDDPYWREFESLIDHRIVRYRTHVHSEAEMIEFYRSARGFVLASVTENWCLAAHEAAACGLPCLLRSQAWSRERFGQEAHYLTDNQARDMEILRRFYMDTPNLPAPQVKQWSWWSVGEQLRDVYAACLKDELRVARPSSQTVLK